MTLECDRCGLQIEGDDLLGKGCSAYDSTTRGRCQGTLELSTVKREPWDQGGPDDRLATMGELRRLAGWMAVRLG